jgi:phage/plasmid-associated DNA primase
VANIIQTVIGNHNVAQLRVNLLGERFELAHYIGKTLLVSADVPGDFLNHKYAQVLKTLVGGDPLNPEQKNRSGRPNMKGEFNVIITSNTRLRVRLDADSGAWRRRLAIIDYALPPTEKPIPHFADQLISTEGAGILNWCIEGAVQLLSELNTTGHIDLTSEQTERVEALLCESDSVRYFVRECVEKRELEDVTTNELLTSYNYYCDERGWQGVATRQFENQIGDVMMDLHRVPRRSDIKRNNKNQRGFSQVALTI